MISDLLSIIRVKYWIKNVLIFLPAFFGGVIQNNGNAITLFYLFVYFSISASLAYILNDLIDIEKDRLHPQYIRVNK